MKNVITISANGANTGATFYQSKEFTVLQDAYAINWIYDDTKLTERQYLFLVGAITKTIRGNYEWTNKAGWEKIKNEKIQLPTKNNEIDFDLMEELVIELENEKILELYKFLKLNELNDYILTSEEEKSIKDFNKIEWHEYKVNELFSVMTSKKRFDANKVTILENGKYPYIVRMSSNNGQNGFIDEDISYLNDKNTLSFGQDTATVFYQEKPYFTGDKIKVLKAYDKKFNKNNALWFVTVISNAFKKFSWGASSFNTNVIENQKIFVPIINGEIDYEFIENYMEAIHKLVIKDVVIYVKNKCKEIYAYGKEDKIDNVKDVHGQVDYENSSNLNMVAEDGEDYN